MWEQCQDAEVLKQKRILIKIYERVSGWERTSNYHLQGNTDFCQGSCKQHLLILIQTSDLKKGEKKYWIMLSCYLHQRTFSQGLNSRLFNLSLSNEVCTHSHVPTVGAGVCLEGCMEITVLASGWRGWIYWGVYIPSLASDCDGFVYICLSH